MLGLAGILLMVVGWLASFRFPWPKDLLFYGGNFALVCFFLGATLTVGMAVGVLERLARPLAVWLYRSEGALGSANVRRAVGRTTLTVASLMVALTMIISIESLAYSFESDLKSWIDNALGGDLYVRAPLPMRESFASQLHSVPGVQTVTPARVLAVKAASGSLPSSQDTDFQFLYEALDPASFRQIGDMEFAANQGDPQASWKRLNQGKAIFISSMVADRYDLHQGDELVLLTRRGERPFYIAAEVTDFGGQGQVIYGTYEDMDRWFNEGGVDRFTLDVAPNFSIDEVSQEIERRFKDSQNISLQTTSVQEEHPGPMDQSSGCLMCST
jgi:putative ABC transport system permease protein